MFNIVLVEPEIPPNTGNIGRLCLATGSTLHLVKPLGFSLNDRQLKRAGLDYWNEVDVQVWSSFTELQSAKPTNARYFFLTTKSQRPYYTVEFRKGDLLVFGRETKGLPEALLAQNLENCLTIPIRETRSLNLATAVAVVLFEAVRQQAQLVPPASGRPVRYDSNNRAAGSSTGARAAEERRNIATPSPGRKFNH